MSLATDAHGTTQIKKNKAHEQQAKHFTVCIFVFCIHLCESVIHTTKFCARSEDSTHGKPDVNHAVERCSKPYGIMQKILNHESDESHE